MLDKNYYGRAYSGQSSECRDSVKYAMTKSPKIIAVAGGKGGVGKTVFATMLGICLAGFGRRTVLIDLDFSGANLHGYLNIYDLSRSLNCFFADASGNLADMIQPTCFVQLDVIPLRSNVYFAKKITTRHKRRLFSEMLKIKADYVIVDLGSASGDFGLDAFLGADHGIILTTSDMFSVLNTYTFIRTALLHGIRKYCSESSAVLSALDECCPQERIKPFRLAANSLEGLSEERLEFARSFGQNFRPKVVLNSYKPSDSLSDFVLLSPVVQDFLDITLENWGRIRYDPCVRTAVREQRPDLFFSPFSQASEDIVRLVVRRLLAEEYSTTDVRPQNASHIKNDGFDDIHETVICQKKCLLWSNCPSVCEDSLCSRIPAEQLRKAG